MGQLPVVKPFGDVRVTGGGKVSQNATFVSELNVQEFATVKVKVEMPPTGIDGGLKLLVIDGATPTCRAKEAGPSRLKYPVCPGRIGLPKTTVPVFWSAEMLENPVALPA